MLRKRWHRGAVVAVAPPPLHAGEARCARRLELRVVLRLPPGRLAVAPRVTLVHALLVDEDLDRGRPRLVVTPLEEPLDDGGDEEDNGREHEEGPHADIETSMLDDEDLVEARGWGYERLDGAIGGKERQQAIDRFSDPM